MMERDRMNPKFVSGQHGEERSLCGFLLELPERQFVAIGDARQHRRHAAPRRWKGAEVIREIDESREIALDDGTLFLEKLAEDFREKAVQHDMNDVAIARQLIDLLARWTPRSIVEPWLGV